MQPYAFPYAGYFGLLASVEDFVFYDDVSYIKQGWINSNFIASNGRKLQFSMPVSKGSSNRKIADVELNDLPRFKKKFLRTLEQSYSRAPFFDAGWEYVNSVLKHDFRYIAELAKTSVLEASSRLEISPRFHSSSISFGCSLGEPPHERLIHIGKTLGKSTYVNPINGASLYRSEEFSAQGLALKFLSPRLPPYLQQGIPSFLGHLSVIDLFMNMRAEDVAAYIREFDLTNGQPTNTSSDTV